ncbi:hypothetical protein CR513_20997, partial [Mucuna pruriens]
MVKVNDPDQKFFVKAFQKGLRSLSMEEIRTRVEKHIKVEEDQVDCLEVERQSGTRDMQPTSQGNPRGE